MKLVMHCEHCNFENAERNLYCKRCGAPLPVLVPYHPSIEDYISPPQTPLESQPFHFIYYPRPKISPLKVVRDLFYFVIALPVTLFGLTSGLTLLGDGDTSSDCLTLMAFLAVLCASMIMFYRSRNRKQYLSWRGFILWIMGLTTGTFLAFCTEIAVIPMMMSKSEGSTLTCSLIMLYGLALQGVSLW